MIKKQYIFILIPLLLIQATVAHADKPRFSDRVFDNRIKTVLLHREGWELSYPIIRLRSDDRLILKFDLLGDNIETYYYTIIHCNKDWEESDIFRNDYTDGFDDIPIEDYKSSFNTTINYTHYSLTIPNERMTIKLSGNYILKVFPTGDPDNPVITRRFMVTEDAVLISADVHRPLMTSESNHSQQVDFTIRYQGNSIIDPRNNIFAFIIQNGRWDRVAANLVPDFIGNNELRYSSLSEKTTFRGGNEFRYFDIKSIRYQSEYIRSIDFLDRDFHVRLTPSENREFKPYFYWQDFNGKYIVAHQEGRDPDTDADYVNVYFSLPASNPVPGGKLYVSGAFNNWMLNENNLMVYEPATSSYQTTVLLKQGWYNYEYVFLPEGSATAVSKFEGDHFETENDYTILVYYRNPRDRYDRLTGSLTLNTLNRISR